MRHLIGCETYLIFIFPWRLTAWNPSFSPSTVYGLLLYYKGLWMEDRRVPTAWSGYKMSPNWYKHDQHRVTGPKNTGKKGKGPVTPCWDCLLQLGKRPGHWFLDAPNKKPKASNRNLGTVFSACRNSLYVSRKYRKLRYKIAHQRWSFLSFLLDV